MPDIVGWFKNTVTLPWEVEDVSPYDYMKGPPFHIFPLTSLLPLLRPLKRDLLDAPSPLWITEIDSDWDVGKVNSRGDGAYLIDLPSSFNDYIQGLSYDKRKKFRNILRRNEDLEVKEGSLEDALPLWPIYVERIQYLNESRGYPLYTEEHLKYRRELYFETGMKVLTFFLKGEIIATNLSRWDSVTVLDIVCMMKFTEELKNRSLGMIAILKNIELAISKGMKTFNLLGGSFGYKPDFGAREVKQKHYVKCSLEFARYYGIPEDEISEVVKG